MPVRLAISFGLWQTRSWIETTLLKGHSWDSPAFVLTAISLATCEHRTGELIVKLSEERVSELIAGGEGVAFSSRGPRVQGVGFGLRSR